jgi:hypothetical protein
LKYSIPEKKNEFKTVRNAVEMTCGVLAEWLKALAHIVFYGRDLRARVQIPTELTRSARCLVIALGKLCTRKAQPLTNAISREMSVGANWGKNDKSCEMCTKRSDLGPCLFKGRKSDDRSRYGSEIYWANLLGDGIFRRLLMTLILLSIKSIKAFLERNTL